MGFSVADWRNSLNASRKRLAVANPVAGPVAILGLERQRNAQVIAGERPIRRMGQHLAQHGFRLMRPAKFHERNSEGNQVLVVGSHTRQFVAKRQGFFPAAELFQIFRPMPAANVARLPLRTLGEKWVGPGRIGLPAPAQFESLGRGEIAELSIRGGQQSDNLVMPLRIVGCVFQKSNRLPMVVAARGDHRQSKSSPQTFPVATRLFPKQLVRFIDVAALQIGFRQSKTGGRFVCSFRGGAICRLQIGNGTVGGRFQVANTDQVGPARVGGVESRCLFETDVRLVHQLVSAEDHSQFAPGSGRTGRRQYIRARSLQRRADIHIVKFRRNLGRFLEGWRGLVRMPPENDAARDCGKSEQSGK